MEAAEAAVDTAEVADSLLDEAANMGAVALLATERAAGEAWEADGA
jgi:hypothetical protein